VLLSFPAESVGTVASTVDRAREEWPAQGELTVPDGTEVSLDLSTADPRVLAGLPLRGVHKVSVEELTDEGLRVLCRLEGLTAMSIAGKLSDEGLSALSTQAGLQTLVVTTDRPLGPGLGHLSSMAELTLLVLLGEPVRLDDLPVLPALRAIMTNTGAAAIDPGPLAAQPALTEVMFHPAAGEQSLLDTLPLRRALPNASIDKTWHAPAMLERIAARAGLS
jgi:hypothetical protein